MISKQRGMVLPITITMIIILTLIVLSLMQAVFLYLKASNNQIANHKNLYELEALANQLIDLNAKPECIVNEQNPNILASLLLQNHGCLFKYNKKNYYYIIADLGIYSCLQIKILENIYSSHHWLISVIPEPPKQHLLQLRVAKPYTLSECLLDEAKMISSGIISWKFI